MRESYLDHALRNSYNVSDENKRTSNAEEVVEEVAGALQCGPGTIEDGGICIIDESGSFNPQIEEGTFSALIIPTAIAFGIGMAVLVALALIARAHRK